MLTEMIVPTAHSFCMRLPRLHAEIEGGNGQETSAHYPHLQTTGAMEKHPCNISKNSAISSHPAEGNNLLKGGEGHSSLP
jgi:hypothetical protein